MIFIFVFAFVLLLVIMDIKNRNKYFAEIVGYIPKGAEVLDFGSGHCELKKYLATRNEVTSVDIHKSCPSADVYDGYHLPYEDQSFDVVVSSFVLHHIPHNEQMIKELQRVTRKRVLVVEDMPNTWYERLVSKLHYLLFKQSPDMIKYMHPPEHWSKIMGGGCDIRRMRARSLINPTPHYIIVKDL